MQKMIEEAEKEAASAALDYEEYVRLNPTPV